jgi:TonB family protein
VCQAASAGAPTTATPLENPGNWITNEDYPSRALRYEKEGVVGFLISIDTTGTPSSCAIIQSSNSEDLDTQTCNLMMQRARFSPARDAKGEAITATYRSRVRWTVPRGTTDDIGPTDIHPMEMVASFTIGTDGKEHDCAIEKMSGKPPFPMPTGMCEGSETFVVATDKDGKPVPRRVHFRMSIAVEDLPPSP